MKLEKTHMDHVRTEAIKNAVFIQNNCSFTDIEYKSIIFELGCLFLEDAYEVGTLQYMRVATNKLFWKWWRAEYHVWENNFIEDAKLVELPINHEIYIEEMTVMVHCSTISQSYIEFLKIIKPRKPN